MKPDSVLSENVDMIIQGVSLSVFFKLPERLCSSHFCFYRVAFHRPVAPNSFSWLFGTHILAFKL